METSSGESSLGNVQNRADDPIWRTVINDCVEMRVYVEGFCPGSGCF